MQHLHFLQMQISSLLTTEELAVETLPQTVLFSVPIQDVNLSFRKCRARLAHVPDYAYVLQGLCLFFHSLICS